MRRSRQVSACVRLRMVPPTLLSVSSTVQPPIRGRDDVHESACDQVSRPPQHEPARSPDDAIPSRLAASRPGIAVLGVVLAAITLLQCWRYEPLSRPITVDDQVYFYISERAAAGVPPHVSLVDHKHQLTALLSAAAMSAGRPLGIDDVIAARVLS